MAAADPKISYAATDAMLDAFDTAVAAGKLRIYESGSSPPANADAAIAGTLLAELTFGTPAFGAADDGDLTAEAITPDSDANAAGTADYFRIWDSAGTTCYFQGTAGEDAEDLILDDEDITLHATVAVSSLVLTLARE